MLVRILVAAKSMAGDAVQVPLGFSHESSHINHTCPHCGVLSMHKKVIECPGYTAALTVDVARGGTVFFHAVHIHFIFRCVNCTRDTYIYYRPQFLNGSNAHPESPPAAFLHQYPVYIPVVHISVPVGIASAAIEAEKCLGIGAPNACGVMTRRAMHSLCEDKSATGRDLFAQLKDLKDKQIITPDLHDWADSLRILGRDGAHPEFSQVTQDDAQDGVKLLREIVKFVYILPYERAEKRRSK